MRLYTRKFGRGTDPEVRFEESRSEQKLAKTRYLGMNNRIETIFQFRYLQGSNRIARYSDPKKLGEGKRDESYIQQRI